MLAHLGAMLAHLRLCEPSLDLSWGPPLAHLRLHFVPLMLARAHHPKKMIMHVRAARVTDTTLVKPTAYAFLHLRHVASSTRTKPCKTQCFLQNTVSYAT